MVTEEINVPAKKINLMPLAYLASVAFLVGWFVATVQLLQLPETLMAQLKTTDATTHRVLEATTRDLLITLALGTAAALVALVLLLLRPTSRPVTVAAWSASNEGMANEEEAASDAPDQVAQQTRLLDSLLEKMAATTDAEKQLRLLCTHLEAVQGAFYRAEADQHLRFVAGYAFHLPDSQSLRYAFGEGLVGQVAKEGRLINFATVPDNYLTVLSGLGRHAPTHLLICPLLREGGVVGVIELASFRPFGQPEEALVQRAAAGLAITQAAPTPEAIPA